MVGQLRAHWNQKYFLLVEGAKKNSKIFFFEKKILLQNFYEKNIWNLVETYVITVNAFMAHSEKNFLEGTFVTKMLTDARVVHPSTMLWGESKSTNLLKWSTGLISVNARGLISGKNFCWGHIFDMLRATKFLAKKRAHMKNKCWRF